MGMLNKNMYNISALDLCGGVKRCRHIVLIDAHSDDRCYARPVRHDLTAYTQPGTLLQVDVRARLDR